MLGGMRLDRRGWVLLISLLAGTAGASQGLNKENLDLPSSAELGVFGGAVLSEAQDRFGWTLGFGFMGFLRPRIGLGFEMAFVRRARRVGFESGPRLGVPFRWEFSEGQARPYASAIVFVEGPGTPILGGGLGAGAQLDLPIQGLVLDAQARGTSRLSFANPRLTLTATLGVAARW